MARFIIAAFTCSVLFCASIASAAGQVGEKAADFPPGSFTDGGHYSIDDFHGKVLVLYFGCPICPTNRASIPERNKVVEQFQGKPVKFLAITPAQMAMCRGYVGDTKLEMPCFADGLGVMQQRYGLQISLNNIWQVRVINPEGVIVGYDMSAATVERALNGVKWTYKDDGYDPKLAKIVELLEWNQYVPAMTALKPFLKQKNKTGDSARTLLEKVKSNVGQEWAKQAETAMTDDKLKAVDLYTKLSQCFPDDELGKNATDSLKKLKTDKSVAAEVSAQKLYSHLYDVMSTASAEQKSEVIEYCATISAKYPTAVAAKNATELAKELQVASVAR